MGTVSIINVCSCDLVLFSNSVLQSARKELVISGLNIYSHQFIHLIESIPTAQWMQLEKRRRRNRESDGGTPIPEKEFLLAHANSVITNPSGTCDIFLNEDDNLEINDHVKNWTGNECLTSEDESHHKPRLRLELSTHEFEIYEIIIISVERRLRRAASIGQISISAVHGHGDI